MGYSTPDQVRSALSSAWEEGVITNTAADMDDPHIEEAINSADERINSYIGERYVTPVVPLPEPPDYPDGLVFLSRDLACYFATLTWRKSKDLTNDDPVARRYVDAMALLTLIARGQASLPIPPNTGDTGNQGAGAPVNPYEGDLFGTRDFDLYPPRGGWDRWARYGR